MKSLPRTVWLVCLLSSLLSLTAGAASFRGMGGVDQLPGTASQTTLRGQSSEGNEFLGSAAGVSGPAAFTYREESLSLEVVPVELAGGGFSSAAVGRVPDATGTLRYTVGFSQATNARRIWIETREIATNGTTVQVVPSHPAPGVDMIPVGIGLNQRVAFNAAGAAFAFDAATSSFLSLPVDEVHAIDVAGTRLAGDAPNPAIGQTEALLWDESQGSIALGVLPGGQQSTARGLSPSGRIVVGGSESSRTSSGEFEAFRWHPDLGMHALDPIVDGGPESIAFASSNENTVVGAYGSSGSPEAFLWTPFLGRRDLRNYLVAEHGLGPQLLGWTLTEATHISADGRLIAGNGTNPNGDPESWIVDLDGPDIAEVRLRPIDPTGSPSTWQLYVECGDLPISELYFGLILPEAFQPDDFYNFGSCNQVVANPNLFGCGGTGSLGPNVKTTSFITKPFINPTSSQQRPDTIYFNLVGQGGSGGGTICEPGEGPVFLGPFAVLSGRPELVRSAFHGSNGIDDTTQTDLPDRSLSFLVEPSAPAADVRVLPALGNTDGTRWSVTLESETEFGCFSFGIILPPDEANAFFGDCNVPENGGVFNERSCASAVDLSPHIEASRVRTIGPSPNLAGSGLRTDTLYVSIEGGLPGPAVVPTMNVTNRKTELGIFSFTGVSPASFGRVPTVSLEGLQHLDTIWNDLEDWCDSDGTDVMAQAIFSSSGFGPVGDSDDDGDGVPTSVDLCPYVYESIQQDIGTLEIPSGAAPVSANEPDYIGDLCQCGDVNQSATVIQDDVATLRSVLADPGLASGVLDAYKCNSVGPSLPGVMNPETGLPRDCNLSDVFALLKARAGEGPLLVPGSRFASCPDVVAPLP